MKDGKAWGVVYEDGRFTEYGWMDPEDAPIHNPEYCTNPLNVTYSGSHYSKELSTGKIFKVKRIITVEVLSE